MTSKTSITYGGALYDLAKDEGLNATGMGAETLPQYWLKNYGREALAWIKYWGQKYLHLPLE